MANRSKIQCPECLRLQGEINRLKALLSDHGICCETQDQKSVTEPPPSHETLEANLSPTEKITMFRKLFRGRTDMYPIRWTSAKGKSGYSPACSNEWKSGICGKPRTKCGDCDNRNFLPVTDQVIYNHLAGQHTVGVYPLMQDDTCFFLAVDFDDSDWREDSLASSRHAKRIKSLRPLKYHAQVKVLMSGFSSKTLFPHEMRGALERP